jgi:hypothetical protein
LDRIWDDIRLTSDSHQGCSVILRQGPGFPFPQPDTTGFRPALFFMSDRAVRLGPILA